MILLYEFLEKINTLKRTPRMGWIESGVDPSDSEDVAQHSFETATITLLLSYSVEKDIDKEKAIQMSVIHDWAESVTGDLSKERSEAIGDEAKMKMEESVMEESLIGDLSFGESLLDLWREYTKGETLESKLVFIADRLSILMEASYLFRQGKKSEKLKEIWSEVSSELDSYTEEFPVLADLLKNLEGNYPFHE